MNQGNRVFIAISLSEAISKKIEVIQDKLKKTKADVRWVKPANIHLTLKFLGNITPEQISGLKQGLEKIARKFQPFSIFIEEMGSFPSIDSPRVIWVGISRGKEILNKMNKAIEDDLAKIGFPREERAFHPHLTLGRCRSSKHRSQLAKQIKTESAFLGALAVDRISIYKSLLTSEGPVYSLLSDVVLKGRA
ncbi:MAG: RNA 2',3'-cyclic phosphodiesterase [Candidatus Ratteibacteria bacterium]|nr:RNA 2',3'-cyclic phosphodiesterase [Candidatus Ratteibacteria bacterium]